MRETRSSSVSPSIMTEAASIVASVPLSKTGIACSTVMSSSTSSPGGSSQTIALDTGRLDLLTGRGGRFESAPSGGVVSVATAGLGSTAGEDFSAAAAGRLEADAGGGLVSRSAGGGLVSRSAEATLVSRGLAFALERLLPNASQASKNAATPVSVGPTSCELNSTVRLS